MAKMTPNEHLLNYAATGDSVGILVSHAYGANLFATNENGDDAVRIAARNSHFETVRVIQDLRGDRVALAGHTGTVH